jgi:hypothetical protein
MIRRPNFQLVAVVATVVPLIGCAPQSRFEWGAYEPSLYAYYKNPADKAQYEAELTKAIALGRRSGRVAPGLCAELGYMRLEDGNSPEAIVDFNEEMQLFPESRPFLSGVVQRLAPTGTAKGPTS